MTKGLWLKGNTLLCPEHLHGLSAGTFLNASCQHPSGSEECFAKRHARREACEERWRKRALVNHLKHIILQAVD